MRMRLSTRLILGVVLIEAIMLSLLVWNSVRLISSSHAELLENSTLEETQLIANNLAPGLLANDVAMINDSLSLVRKHRSLVQVDVHDRNGKIVASLNKDPHFHSKTETHAALLKGESQSSEVKHDETYEDATSDGIFDVIREIKLYGQYLGKLHAGYSIESVLNLTKKTRLQNTSIAVVGITLSIVATILLGFFLTRGLRKLEESAQILGSGNLEHRIEIKSNDEISDVARSFNQMAGHLSEGRAKLEQRVKERTEELEKASTAKSEFLSRMSHELRTPLNAILGFGQVLEIEAERSGAETDSIKEILQAGDHLLELINEVLDLSKIEAGKLDISIDSVSIYDLFDGCISLLKPLIKERDLTFIEENEDSINYYIKADKIRVKQVLLNILSNAIKYNKLGGKVILEFHTTANNKIRISVTDTGPGIPVEMKDRLFKPFERLSTSNANTVEGTGIGLALSKRLIELMDGQVGFTSKFGHGSTFWFELNQSEDTREPSQEKITTTHKMPPQAMNGGKYYKVLCIEDNPSNLKLFRQLLSTRADIELLTAHNGELGVDLAKGHCPDLILLDIGLPGISGFEVMKRLSNSEVTKNIPVVAISANAMPNDIEKAKQANFNAYLTKPVKVKEFYRMIENYLPTVNSTSSDSKDDFLFH